MAYVPGHPNQHLRELARRAITDFTLPGDLIIDPMCGAGDVLVEAITAGRLAIGVEHLKRWVDVARQRIESATGDSNCLGYGVAVQGDPLDVVHLVGADVKGEAALVIVTVHSGTARCLQHSDNVCGDLARGFAILLEECGKLLRSNGRLVVISKPVKHNACRFELAEMAHESALNAGYVDIGSTGSVKAQFSVYEICASVPAGGNSTTGEGRSV